jgi:phosphate starvation-inducible PhoH-like protein
MQSILHLNFKNNMKEPNRERKTDIKYLVSLNEEQREAKRLIIENQIVIITGRAGSGKSLVGALTALDFLNKKQCEKILVTRATIEVGKSLGYLPGALNDKFDPYMEALKDNLYKCWDKQKVDDLINNKKLEALPLQFVRGKTIDDVLIVEESQNMTKQEMLAVLTRLGKTGKIIINGDNEQQDTRESITGLSYAIELSKKLKEIKWVKLKENHRSDLVGKILDIEYGNS